MSAAANKSRTFKMDEGEDPHDDAFEEPRTYSVHSSSELPATATVMQNKSGLSGEKMSCISKSKI